MKGKLKTIAFLLVLILLCSIIAPTMNVFAENSISTIEFLVSREDGNEFFGDLKITEDINDEDNNPSTVYKIHIQADFGSAFAEDGIKINNDTMPVSEGTEQIDYYMETPLGNKFDIVLKYVPNLNRNFNIIWVYNTEAAERNNFIGPDGQIDCLVKNGKVEIVKAELPDGTVLNYSQLTATVEEDRGHGMGRYPVNDDANYDDGNEEGYGYASFIPGTEVTIKLIPDYGYQVTSASLNDTQITPQAEQSTFTFIMPQTDLHLAAVFTKVGDVVKSSTDKVTSGTVKIGANEITTGSTVLNVSDASLTDTQKQSFSKAVEDYEVSTYLDIKLNQVIYKGSDSNVWSNELKELNNEATITLQLEEGVNGNEVVILHEKHDGSYEVIETIYDESTNTITFSTSSFSNYAIASKKTENTTNTETDNKVDNTTNTETDNKVDNTTNPQTGDNIIMFIIIFALALTGILATCIISRKRVKNNK